MNNDKETESFCGMEDTEKPLKVIEGEGSGVEPKVVEKKKIFFFGQAGCLKHSPIKTFIMPNHNNHSKPVEIPTTPSITEKESKVEETASDDEIELLEKISVVLDEPKKKENSSATPNSDETSTEINSCKPECSSGKSETISNEIKENILKSENDSQLNNNKLENKIKSVEIEKSLEQYSVKEPTISESLEKIACEVDDNEINEVEESKVETKTNTTPEKSVSPKPFSIVPYDDDSTTSSQINMDQDNEDQEKEIANIDEIISAESKLFESASRSSAAENIESLEYETIQDQIEELSNTVQSDAAQENINVEKSDQKKENPIVALKEKEETSKKTDESEGKEKVSEENLEEIIFSAKIEENSDKISLQEKFEEKLQDENKQTSVLEQKIELKEPSKTEQIKSEEKLEPVIDTQVENHQVVHDNLYTEISLHLENIADIPLPSDKGVDQTALASKKVVEDARKVSKQENLLETKKHGKELGENDPENISEHEESSGEISKPELKSLNSQDFENSKPLTSNDLISEETERENSLINETVEKTSKPEVSAFESLVPNFKTPVELEITSNSIEIEKCFSNENKKRVEEDLMFLKESALNESIANKETEMKVQEKNLATSFEEESSAAETENYKEPELSQPPIFPDNEYLESKETENTEKSEEKEVVEIEQSTLTLEKALSEKNFSRKDSDRSLEEREINFHDKKIVSEVLESQEISIQSREVLSTPSDNEEELSPKESTSKESFPNELEKVSEIGMETDPQTEDLLMSEPFSENKATLEASPTEQTQSNKIIEEPETMCAENEFLNKAADDVEDHAEATQDQKQHILVTVQNDSEHLAKEILENKKILLVEKETAEPEKNEEVQEFSGDKIDKGPLEKNANEKVHLESIDSDDEDFNDFDGANESNGMTDESENEQESVLVETVKPEVIEKQPEPKSLDQSFPVGTTSFSEEIKTDIVESIENKSAKVLTKIEIVQKNVEIVPVKLVELVQDKKVIKENIVEETTDDSVEDASKNGEELSKLPVTRKRKISERKSLSESDSDSNIATENVCPDNSSDGEEVVQKKKPRIRGKTASPRKMPPRKVAKKVEEETKKVKLIVNVPMEIEKTPEKKSKDDETKETLQSLKFDYDENDDVAANVAAIKTMICKESNTAMKKESSDEEDSDERISVKRGRRGKRSRFGRNKETESSSDEDPLKITKADSKKKKTENVKSPLGRKKRETGMLKHIDKSLVIDASDETPVRQSRRIAQQKIREETERRQMEEKMLRQMKAEAEKKKKSGESEDEVDEIDEAYEEEQKDSSDDDQSFVESKKKRKSKILPADKQWQTSSSHSEHSESEDYMEHVPSDPGSPLFKSDHEFSPESDDEDTTQVQPLKRARTAKKTEAIASSGEDEDINPNHACQVCHKTDSPEWILLCDGCDCGYHCSCLKPIIFLIPSGTWFCPQCCHKKLIENLSEQLTQLDTLMYNIETLELKKQRQKLAEINQQNILQEKKRIRAERASKSREKTPESKESSGSGSESEDSSDDEPLKYKLRKRNQTAAPSYRFNEYDDLINSAIKRDMDEVKGAGNLGRGKDISTIIEAGMEEKKQDNNHVDEKVEGKGEPETKVEKENDGESSGSDVIRSKKLMKKKKKKLNNLDDSSEAELESDEDFKGSSSSDSEVDEEDLSMSSVSESSLDLPSKRKKGKRSNIRTLRTREKRTDRRFINDNDSDDSDNQPLIKAKRSKKKDSDEEEFDVNDDDDEEGSLAEDIDSDDLCDDTETDSSSGGNWPRKKKKRVASYDVKPRKPAKKKDENEDKAFRAGISKQKVLKKSDNESEASGSDTEKGKRKTRGKKLLYLIEDDLDSDESDGIRPGVKRPETPPEEREMFFKKQEEIKRMLAAKDTEAAKKLALPTIEPIHIPMEKPKSPVLPFSNEPASLSTIPKNVIESAKALDTDYNRILKPLVLGSQSKVIEPNSQSSEMNEEELARMMEEEDFAQHQLKLAGEAIARKKLLDLEAKELEFVAFAKAAKEKEVQAAESKKRNRKPKAEKLVEDFSSLPKAQQTLQGQLLASSVPPPLINSNPLLMPLRPQMQQQPPPSLIANMMQHQQLPHVPTSINMMNDRPSVLSTFMTRPDMHPHHLKIHQPIPPDVFNSKMPPLPPHQQFEETEEKKKGRRKKFTPLRTDLPEGNNSKLAKLDLPSVIQAAPHPADRVDDKNKVLRPDHPKLSVAAPPQIFHPATNTSPSVITRLLQPQQRPGPGPFNQVFDKGGQPENPNIRMYPSQEELKNMSPNKTRGLMPQVPQPTSIGTLPATSFAEHPGFASRGLHPLYRGPTPYGIPPHARLPPYPFHALHHPNLRPGEYSSPYNIPPQFSYYAPPAHSRQPPQSSAIPLNHGAPQHVAGEDIPISIRNASNPQEPPTQEAGGSSEFGGLINFFNSQQELD